MNDHVEDTSVAAPDPPSPDDPSTADASSTVEEGTTHPRPPGRGPSWWIGWALAVVGLIGCAVLGVLLVRSGGADAERAAAEEAAGRFALALTTWDAGAGELTDTREQLREASTDTFDSEVELLFGSTDDLNDLEEIGARSTSEVEQLLVQELDGDRADVLAVIVQRVTTEITEGEEVSLRYARMGMLREGGTWRVNEVELLVDLLQESAERAPGTNIPGELDLDGADAEDAG